MLAATVAVMAGRPLVVTAHVGPIPYRSRIARAGMAAATSLTGRCLLTRASVVAFVSERVRADFKRRWHLRREMLLPNGVDFELFKPATAAERKRVRGELGLPGGPGSKGARASAGNGGGIVLFVGRFVERKGLGLLREVASRLPEVQFVLAGNGPMDPAAWQLPNVHVERSRRGPGIAELYAAADLLVLPSLGEGFPLVVEEALAAGLPVLVDPSTVAGHPPVEAVAEAEPVAGRDAPTRWAARIQALLAEPATREGRRRRATFAREHWDWDRAAAEYMSIFAGLPARK
jgi:glycosyltransferase involved in cell wall biosynthesis